MLGEIPQISFATVISMRDTIFTFDITPMGKPRMTQRDKWKNTRTAQADRYLVYRDTLQILALQNKYNHFTFDMRIKFYLPNGKIHPGVPKHLPEVHLLKPDLDNLIKGFFDALYPEDQKVYHIDAYKFWTTDTRGRIEVEHL